MPADSLEVLNKVATNGLSTRSRTSAVKVRYVAALLRSRCVVGLQHQATSCCSCLCVMVQAAVTEHDHSIIKFQGTCTSRHFWRLAH